MKNAITYIIIALSLGLVATSTFAYRYYSETPKDRANRENLESYRGCTDKARKLSVFEEAVLATSACEKSSRKYEVKELQETTGTASLAPLSEAPLGKNGNDMNASTGVYLKNSTEGWLRRYLGQGNCRDTTDYEDGHHIGNKIRQWIAYDIACTAGSNFDVYTPYNWDDRDMDWSFTAPVKIKAEWWVIEKVGYGSLLGKYIILKDRDSDIRIVYGHTELLKGYHEGQWISPGFRFAQTQSIEDVRKKKAGATTGVHLHVELWKGTYNVSREIFWSDVYEKEDRSDLLAHRKWDFSK